MDAESYRGLLPDEEEKRILKIKEEMATFARFVGYVVMYPGQKGKNHNSVAHAERAISVVRT